MCKDFIKFNLVGMLLVMVDDNMCVLCGLMVIVEFFDEIFGIFKWDKWLLVEDLF